MKRYQEMGVAGLEDRRGKRLASQTPRTAEEALRIEKSRLERENYLLRMELDLLKSAGAGEGGSLRQFRQERQYQAVRWAAEEQGYPVAEACRALHISRAGYYQWHSGKEGARTVENRRLAGLVKQIHNESPDKGYRRIRDDLARYYATAGRRKAESARRFLRISICTSWTSLLSTSPGASTNPKRRSLRQNIRRLPVNWNISVKNSKLPKVKKNQNFCTGGRHCAKSC